LGLFDKQIIVCWQKKSNLAKILQVFIMKVLIAVHELTNTQPLAVLTPTFILICLTSSVLICN